MKKAPTRLPAAAKASSKSLKEATLSELVTEVTLRVLLQSDAVDEIWLPEAQARDLIVNCLDMLDGEWRTHAEACSVILDDERVGDDEKPLSRDGSELSIKLSLIGALIDDLSVRSTSSKLRKPEDVKRVERSVEDARDLIGGALAIVRRGEKKR